MELDHETIPVTMDPGSILIFSGNTWHGHGQNKTDRHRRTLNMLYCCDWLKPTHGYCSGIPENEVKTLPQALQTLLGVKTKSPYSRQTTPYLITFNLYPHTVSRLARQTDGFGVFICASIMSERRVGGARYRL